MECLFFLSFSSSILLACYDGTCYLDETLHCNMYGWNLLMYEQCVWLKLMWYVIWNLCAGYVIWKYIYICHIYFLCKLWDLIKNRKNSQYAGSLPSATDGNGLFAVSHRRQRSHVAANCASWELAHLVSLPTVANDKFFAICSGRQRPAVNHLTE